MWAEDINHEKSLGYWMGVFTALIVGGVSLLGGICVYVLQPFTVQSSR